jgi:pimeloyl-ACP methyl ester carboxylesterase
VALAALSSGDGITVGQTPAGWTFRPTAAAPAVGFVLYPGGHVDPRAYAPLAREIARRGYLVVVPQVPLSLAFFDIDAAGRAISENPTVKTWAVGGHSLGGTASTIYVANHPGTISGLVLLASYPPDGTNLSQAKGPSGAPLAALSVRGSNDGLVTPAKIEHAKPLLPASTIYVTIPGGNHAQFGDYGIQSGDGTPEITADTQVTKTAGLVSLFLGSLK